MRRTQRRGIRPVSLQRYTASGFRRGGTKSNWSSIYLVSPRRFPRKNLPSNPDGICGPLLGMSLVNNLANCQEHAPPSTMTSQPTNNHLRRYRDRYDRQTLTKRSCNQDVHQLRPSLSKFTSISKRHLLRERHFRRT